MIREENLKRLKKESFDLLIIGGGATGSGCALDAATRRLKVALVERFDFASGTSSRSTKLIHGGVRYLEQAVLKFDMSQFRLVRDALHERSTLLRIAPHLSRPLPILTPLYNRIDVPYYRTGLRLYDRLAGKSSLHKSYFIGSKEALKRFPMLKAEKLRGGVVYYDGQFDDARMNISIVIAACEQGAAVGNYVEVIGLKKEKNKIRGVQLRDHFTRETWTVEAKVVVNAAGPFLDHIRHMDDPRAPKILSTSSGTHIVLDHSFSPPNTGLLIPKTDDGRVLFILPWLGHTLIGTTDNPAPLSDNPHPTDEDINYILMQSKRYFSLSIDRSQILSAWTGLRPLVANLKAADTAKLSRDHIINVSPSGLVTIGGGKWTTYRKMALDTVNQAIQTGNLKAKGPSLTEKTPLAGGEKFNPKGAALLAKRFALPSDVCQHLNQAYGSRAPGIGKLAVKGLKNRLAKKHPYLEAEVIYAARDEAARTTSDILARRTRLAFLDKAAAVSAIERVSLLLGDFLARTPKQIQEDAEEALRYLDPK